MNQTKHKTNSFSARYTGLIPAVKKVLGMALACEGVLVPKGRFYTPSS
ncbi:hypothetical protein [Hymenobacter terrenus]|nr:hypothetical protein [Hymenobacter terrenus]